MEKENEPKVMNATKAAKHLGVSRSKFYKLLRSGVVAPIKLDQRLYSKDVLDSLLSAR